MKAEINERLSDICDAIRYDILEARDAKRIWTWIAEHADEINNAKPRPNTVIIYLQNYAQTEFFIRLGRIFDKRRDANCIKSLATAMKKSKLTNSDILRKYMQSEFSESSIWNNMDNSTLQKKGVEKIMKCKMINGSGDNHDKFRTIRNTEIAHNSAQKNTDQDRLTWDEAQTMLDWAAEFLDMTWKAFSQTAQYSAGDTFVQNSRIPDPVQALINLTDKLGIVENPRLIDSEKIISKFAEQDE